MRRSKPSLVPRRYYINLYEIAKSVNSSLRVCEVLSALAQSTAYALDAKGCAALLLSPDKKRWWYGATWGLSESYVSKSPISTDESIIEAFSKAHSVLVFNASKDERVQYREEAKKEGIASILSVPLTVKGSVIGILSVYTSDPRMFPEEEINFVEAVADLAAIALQNARLCECARKSDADIAHDILEWYASWEQAERYPPPPPF
jgi:GAF domain-containing protein